MKYTHKQLFLGSILAGVILWLFFYLILPISIPNGLSFFSISFIALNYLSLALGFYTLEFWRKADANINKVRITIFRDNIVSNLLTITIIVVIISFVIRYLELFYVRDLSFLNSIRTNKINASKPENFLIGINLLSFFRVLYFIPLLLLYSLKKKNSYLLLVVCLLLFLLPLPEAILRGSRRTVFEVILFFVLITALFSEIKLRSFKVIFVSIIGMFLLLIYSKSVIEKRSSVNNTAQKINFESSYSQFVPVKNYAKDYIVQKDSKLVRDILFSGLHFGQYIIHGVYEMDHMINQDPEHKHGLFNGYLFVKFFNKIGFSDIDLGSLRNPSERITYITFFGGLFIDFGWFSLLAMFSFGMLQRMIFTISQTHILAQPIMIVFMFCNLFLLVFNFMRAQFIFTLMVYSVFLGILWLYVKYKTHSGIHFKRNNKISS